MSGFDAVGSCCVYYMSGVFRTGKFKDVTNDHCCGKFTLQIIAFIDFQFVHKTITGEFADTKSLLNSLTNSSDNIKKVDIETQTDNLDCIKTVDVECQTEIDCMSVNLGVNDKSCVKSVDAETQVDIECKDKAINVCMNDVETEISTVENNKCNHSFSRKNNKQNRVQFYKLGKVTVDNCKLKPKVHKRTSENSYKYQPKLNKIPTDYCYKPNSYLEQVLFDYLYYSFRSMFLMNLMNSKLYNNNYQFYSNFVS